MKAVPSRITSASPPPSGREHSRWVTEDHWDQSCNGFAEAPPYWPMYVVYRWASQNRSTACIVAISGKQLDCGCSSIAQIFKHHATKKSKALSSPRQFPVETNERLVSPNQLFEASLIDCALHRTTKDEHGVPNHRRPLRRSAPTAFRTRRRPLLSRMLCSSM